MFHISGFGKFAEPDLSRFADLDGFVPQLGDRLEDFNYLGDVTEDLEYGDAWEEFLREAVAATIASEARVTAWREADSSGSLRH